MRTNERLRGNIIPFDIEALAYRYGVIIEEASFEKPIKAALIPVGNKAVLGTTIDDTSDVFLVAEAIGFYALGYVRNKIVLFKDFFEQEITDPQIFNAIKWGVTQLLPHSDMCDLIKTFGFNFDAMAQVLHIDKRILYLRFHMDDLHNSTRFLRRNFSDKYLFLDHQVMI